jgi:CubicO group peptidase (beta-lactamase class C family)
MRSINSGSLSMHNARFDGYLVYMSFRGGPLDTTFVSSPRSTLPADALRDTLSELARRYRVPGAQLAIHHGGHTVSVEVGELQHETGHPVRPDSAFAIGSITKSFTATLAMILAADGDLELDAPVADDVPELRNGSDDLGRQLTLRDLLSHTSGLCLGPDSTEVAGASRRRYVLDHCLSQNRVVPPGTGFSYSNIGYVLAGHLIEVVTGMTWWEAVESILLRPLGIEATFIATPDHRPPGRAVATGHSYNASIDRIRPVGQSQALAEAPAGALQMSAVDLVTFGSVHLGGCTAGLLPPAYAEHMREAVPAAQPFGIADGWGLGLALFSTGDTVWVGHDGNADGTACYLRIEPVSGTVVACTTNAVRGIGLWQELVTELAGAGLPIANYSTIERLGPRTSAPPDCVGSYLNGNLEYSVTLERRDALLAIDGENIARLAFHEGFTFAQQDLESGQWANAGRLLPDPISGDFDLIQVGGRLARRHSGGPRES